MPVIQAASLDLLGLSQNSLSVLGQAGAVFRCWIPICTTARPTQLEVSASADSDIASLSYHDHDVGQAVVQTGILAQHWQPGLRGASVSAVSGDFGHRRGVLKPFV